MDELITVLKAIREGGLQNDEALLTLIQAVIVQVNEIQVTMVRQRKEDLKMLDHLGEAIELLANRVVELDQKLGLLGYENARRH